jgi:hypothetical protein
MKKLFPITMLVCVLFGMFCGCRTIASPSCHHDRLFGGGEFSHHSQLHHENGPKKWLNGHKPKSHHRRHEKFDPKFKGTNVHRVYEGSKGKHFRKHGDFKKHGDRRFKKPRRDKKYPGRVGYKKTFTNFKN